VNTSRSFPHSWFIIGFVTRLIRRVPLVEQELPTLPEHLSSPPVFSVPGSLVLCVCFVDSCLSFCPFSFCYCIVCPSSIDGFWLPPCYLQTRRVTRVTRRVPHLWDSYCSIFSFLCHVLKIVVCPFYFCYWIVCPSSIYYSCLPLWYLQTLLIMIYVEWWWLKLALPMIDWLIDWLIDRCLMPTLAVFQLYRCVSTNDKMHIYYYNIVIVSGLFTPTSFSTIFQLYRGGKFYLCR
jgi:hypothetical protein